MHMTPACCLMLAAMCLLAASCGKKETPSSNTAPIAAHDEPLTVSTAASTKELVETICGQFSTSTGTEVRVNAGSSNALAGQILAGAPVDVFLSASQQWADEVEKRGLALASARLLTNRLVMVVPKENPGDIHEPSDLLSDKTEKIALAGEKVPAGMYAEQALSELQLLTALVDRGKIVRGSDVRGALSYVERGEAEAGIVYSTDVRIASGVAVAYEFDSKLHDEIVYVLVLLKHSRRTPAAQKLYDFLQTPKADTTYQEFGFTRLPTHESK